VQAILVTMLRGIKPQLSIPHGIDGHKPGACAKMVGDSIEPYPKTLN